MAQVHLFDKTAKCFVLLFLMEIFLTEIICKHIMLHMSGLFIEFTKIYFTFLLYIYTLSRKVSAYYI